MSGRGYPSTSWPTSGRVVGAIWPRWPLWDVTHLMAALPTAPRQARAQTRAALLSWDMRALTDSAELVVTELVSNAVCASECPVSSPNTQTREISLYLLADRERLRIEVWDQADGCPVLAEVHVQAESGRGLALVNAFTEGHWGWYPAAFPRIAKCVWAEIRLP